MRRGEHWDGVARGAARGRKGERERERGQAEAGAGRISNNGGREGGEPVVVVAVINDALGSTSLSRV
jgi:hypothetical protein